MASKEAKVHGGGQAVVADIVFESDIALAKKKKQAKARLCVTSHRDNHWLARLAQLLYSHNTCCSVQAHTLLRSSHARTNLRGVTQPRRINFTRNVAQNTRFAITKVRN